MLQHQSIRTLCNKAGRETRVYGQCPITRTVTQFSFLNATMSGFIREVFYELYCTVTTPYLHFYFFAHQVLIFLPGATFETGTRSHSVGSHCTPQLSSVLNACWKQLAIVASFTRCRCQALSIQGKACNTLVAYSGFFPAGRWSQLCIEEQAFCNGT